MNRSFIELPLFIKRWSDIGLNDEELRELQLLLLCNPDVGPIMKGTGGIRKVRFPLEKRGKSRSVRVCYVDFSEINIIYLITAFTKDEQANLTDAEKIILKKMVKSLKEEAKKKYGGKE